MYALVILFALMPLGLFLLIRFNHIKLQARLLDLESKLEAVNDSIRSQNETLHRLNLDNRNLSEQLASLTISQAKLQEVSHLQQAVSEQLQNKLQLLESQSSENKLYARAKKMLALGADVEELMTECEISRSEAELMLALHGKG